MLGIHTLDHRYHPVFRLHHHRQEVSVLLHLGCYRLVVRLRDLGGVCLVPHFLHLLDKKDGMVRLDMDSIKRVKAESDKGKVRGCEMIGRSSFSRFMYRYC